MKHSTSGLYLLCMLLSFAPLVHSSQWQPARIVDGITLESLKRDSRYLEHRGAVDLCGDLQTVLEFVSEPAELVNWVPYTAAAERLPEKDGDVVYHVVTRAPWPYKPRDMVYVLDVILSGNQAAVQMSGLPNHIPPLEDMVRMRAADGVWKFVETGETLTVSLRMWVDPGSGPALLVNRRAATTVGRMLANLRSRYPCDGPTTVVQPTQAGVGNGTKNTLRKAGDTVE